MTYRYEISVSERAQIAKKRGVTESTVMRWERQFGPAYARNHIPVKAGKRGPEIVINQKPTSKINPDKESLDRGKLRRACEDIAIARELGEEHLCEVWES